MWLFDTLEACCDRYFAGWNKNRCMNVKGSGLWYIAHQLEKCVTDCNEGQGAYCGGLANPISDNLFANPRSCCENEVPWRFLEFCEAESLQTSCYKGTGKYYRGDITGSIACVKDCDPATIGDRTCGGLVEDTYIVLHDTPEDCCSREYDWMTNQLCVARTTHTDISVFCPDKANSKCVLDSKIPAQDLSISVYDSATECCKKGVHWLSKEACLTASGNSTALAPTNKFFVDWANERCVQDIEGGVVSLEVWDDRFDTISECCDALPWIPEKDCSEAT